MHRSRYRETSLSYQFLSAPSERNADDCVGLVISHSRFTVKTEQGNTMGGQREGLTSGKAVAHSFIYMYLLLHCFHLLIC